MSRPRHPNYTYNMQARRHALLSRSNHPAMLSSLTELQHIINALSSLRTAIKHYGDVGLAGLNKRCEYFVAGLLNVTYSYHLENLNDKKMNFPGLDIGDENVHIAYGVSSINTSDKINDMLDKCLRYEHYRTFPKIKAFVLSKKQGSYTLKHITEPHFSFDPDVDIVDFDDWIKYIQRLPTERLKQIREYIDKEIPDVLAKLTPPVKTETTPPFVIDTAQTMALTNMGYFQDSSAVFQVKTGKLSVANILKGLESLFKHVSHRNYILPAFNQALMVETSSNKIVFHQRARNTGVVNEFFESALTIQPNQVVHEYARYHDNEILLTNLLPQSTAWLSLLLLLSRMGSAPLEIALNAKLVSNGRLLFHPVDSFVKQSSFNTYQLSNGLWHYSETFQAVEVITLIQLLEDMLHGFTAEVQSPGIPLFLSIDDQLTKWNVENLIKHLNLP